MEHVTFGDGHRCARAPAGTVETAPQLRGARGPHLGSRGMSAAMAVKVGSARDAWAAR
jgi:hypothetical protein